MMEKRWWVGGIVVLILLIAIIVIFSVPNKPVIKEPTTKLSPGINYIQGYLVYISSCPQMANPELCENTLIF
jgi:hypothetical protein